jgi:geranylgeranyl diphosphate synthase type II
MTSVGLLDFLSSNVAMLRKYILDYLPKDHSIPEIDLLYKMMRDYPSRPSKGLRPSLCILVCETFGGKNEQAIVSAAALEIFQNWILIHDDVEDESEFRRGGPVLQKLHGIPLAINAGDALHAKMWGLLTKNYDVLGEKICYSIMQEFSRMIDETTEGQHLEVSWTEKNKWNLTEDDYFLMVQKKTSWYTCVSPCRLGYLIATKKPLPKNGFVKFGIDLGIAFQIRDDVLNLTAGKKYGKEIGGDIVEGKRTLVLINLIESASQRDAETIKKIMSRGRHKSFADVQKVLHLMQKYDSIAYAKRRAEEFSESALKQFSQIFGHLPDSKAKLNLHSLVEFMISRDW